MKTVIKMFATIYTATIATLSVFGILHAVVRTLEHGQFCFPMVVYMIICTWFVYQFFCSSSSSASFALKLFFMFAIVGFLAGHASSISMAGFLNLMLLPYVIAIFQMCGLDKLYEQFLKLQLRRIESKLQVQ